MSLVVRPWIPVVVSVITAMVQMAVVYFLVKKKARPDYSFFFIYNVAAVVVGLSLTVLFATNWLTDTQYYYTFVVMNTILLLLEFAVMYELLKVLLKPYAAIIDLGNLLFRWAGLFLLVAAGLTAYATGGSALDKCTAGSMLLEKSLRLMQCGLLLLFFLFERRLSLAWRSRPVSVALGLGISAAVGLTCSYLRTQYVAWYPMLYLVENVTYLGVVSFWMVCFAAPVVQKQNVLDSPSRLIFQRWNEALAGYGYTGAGAPSTVECFLPGIEKTVDRVMARRVV